MGLSVVISSIIVFTVLMMILMIIPGLMDSFLSVGETASKISDLEDSIFRTYAEITSVTAFSGSDLVSFELLNKGEEKLWKWDEFDLFITYDADIGSIKTRVTEQFTYNDVGLGLVPDFNIQRGFLDFGLNEDSTTVTITPVRSFGDGGFAFVRLTNTQHASSGFDGNQKNMDDIGVHAQLTARDTITFTQTGTGQNADYRAAWEVWEYVGPPGGPNEFIVRLNTIASTTNTNNPLDVLVPNVINQKKLVPFITSVLSSHTGNDFDDMIHTVEIVDDGFGNTFARLDKDGAGTNPAHPRLAVVEFTGKNWIIQNNISHVFAAAGANEVETVAGNANFEQAVNAWNEAFIVTTFHTPNGEEEAEEIGYNVWPSATTDSMRFRIEDNSNNVATGNYIAIAHVVENPDITVTHVDSITGGGADFTGGGGDPDIENKGFAAITNPLAETGLLATAESDAGGTAAPRVFQDYRLIADDTVEFRRANDGSVGQWALEVIEFPRFNSPLAASLWSVFNIKNDYVDPGILNKDETAQISVQLSNPIFQDGVVIIQIATDKGVQASAFQVV